MANYSVSYLAPFAGAGHPLLPGRSQDVFFVDTQNGSDDNTGKTLDRPVATITRSIALAEPTSSLRGRSTLIFVAPGEYRERVNVDKPDIAIIGGAGRYPGRTRIVGDGTTGGGTFRVLTGNLRGFKLANLFVETGYPDTTSLAVPAIYLETSDTAELGANSTDEHWELDNVQVISDGLPTAALLLGGATMGRVTNCTFAGCVHGVVFAGSVNNTCADIKFIECDFYNNVTADVATSGATPLIVTLGSTGTDNIVFKDCNFWDVGGTPVTNYVNWDATATNCGFYGCYFNRDIADGTLIITPANVNVVGCWSPSGTESFVGA